MTIDALLASGGSWIPQTKGVLETAVLRHKGSPGSALRHAMSLKGPGLAF